MVMQFFPPPFLAVPKVPFAASYNGTVNGAAAGASITYANVPIGSPSSGRLVVVAVHWAISGSATVTSASIGGVPATIAAQGNGINNGVAFIYARVPTGSTASVVVSFSASVARSYVGCWSIVGQDSDIPTSASVPAGGSTPNKSVTLSALAGGVSIFASQGDTSGSWTGATADYTIVSTDRPSGARSFPAVSGNSTASYSSCRVMGGASWR